MKVSYSVCDNCGKTDKDEKVKFWSLQMSYKHGICVPHRDFAASSTKVIHLCRNCVQNNFGIFPASESEKKIIPDPPLSDLQIAIRFFKGLIREELEESEG